MSDRKKNILLIFLSTFFALVLIEIFLSTLASFKPQERVSSEPGYMLYEQGKVFQNVDKIVKYEPNKKILTKTYVYVNNNFEEAYSYKIETNNFGLVQKDDLQKDVPSILILGDSFTEGQGQAAWINKFNGKFKKYQIINGGILATGPQQFELMEQHVSKFYNIEKVFLLYIGHDIRRSPFSLSKHELECLMNYQNCKGNEIFFGYPIESKSPENFLNNLRNKRIQNYKNLPFNKRLKKTIKSYFSNLYVFKIPLAFLREKFYKSKNIKIKKNLDAMKRLHLKYGENIYFIHLTTRDEIINRTEYESSFAIKNIKDYSNNHFFCKFDNNLEYYDPYHNHPNEKGYNYLFNCVSKIMREQID